MSQTKAQLIDPVDGTIVNADINASAAIAGSKIDPSFTANITITNDAPKVFLTDASNNPDFSIQNANGAFVVFDDTNSAVRIEVNADGHTDIKGNLDCESGLDVTGAITGTGDVTIDTTTFHVDSSNNRVGLGTTSPEDLLHIKGGKIRIENTIVSNNDSTISYDNEELVIDVDPNNVRGSSAFQVDIDGTTGMFIDDNRRVLIGGISSANSTSMLQVKRANNCTIRVANSDATATNFTAVALAPANNTVGASITCVADGTFDGSANQDAHLKFATALNGSVDERLRINSSGNIGFGTTSSAALQGDGGRVFHLAGSNNPEIVLERTTSGTEAKASMRVTDAQSFRIAVKDGTATTVDALSIESDNGDVGIGTVSPDARLHVSRTTDNNTACVLNNGGTNGGHVLKLKSGGTGSGTHIFSAFRNNTEECLRLDGSGNISSRRFIDNANGGDYYILQNSAGGSTSDSILQFFASSTSQRFFLAFNRRGNNVGSISVAGSATTYATSSDYRLKENIVSISDGITRLKTLKAYRFNFKEDPDKTVDGFLAHEVTAVPEAIIGTKDETEDLLYKEEDTIPSGKKVGDVKETVPKYQGIDQSKLVPLLTAALQEEISKRESLEARVAALETA